MKVPKLRFKEFSEKWKRIKLSDIYQNIRNGFVGIATPFYVENGVKYLQGKNIKNGIIGGEGLVYVSREFQEKNKKSQLKLNDIVMVQSGHVGECAVIDQNYVNANCHALVILSPRDNNTVSSKFLVNYFYSPFGRRLIYQVKTGNTIEHILASEVKELTPFIPEFLEQTKIANFLTAIDEKITQLTQKCDLLVQYKKGVMQQIFSQKLRFKDDDGQGFPEWEEKKLGNVGRVSMCKRILKEQTKPTGDVPFYKIGTFGKQTDAYISNEIYESYKTKFSFPKKGDILISAAGTIGRIVVYDGLPAYFQDSNIVWIDNNEKLVTNSFLYFIYANVKWNTENTTIARLYNENLKSLSILVPSLPEQTKIANFLTAVDDKITQAQAQLDAVKLYKKGLLQQMFV